MALVKVCGLTRPEDVRAARGADAIGLVVRSPRSRRDLPLDRARDLAALAHPFQTVVAVTASTDPTELRDILTWLRPDALQLPAAVSPAVLGALREGHPGTRFLLACRPEAVPASLGGVAALVLDALTGDGYGGTGKTLPWAEVGDLARKLPVPVMLAGGLTPGNVAEAIAAARPYAVDVSSGVETDGLKDAKKIHEFIRNARTASGGPSHEA